MYKVFLSLFLILFSTTAKADAGFIWNYNITWADYNGVSEYTGWGYDVADTNKWRPTKGNITFVFNPTSTSLSICVDSYGNPINASTSSALNGDSRSTTISGQTYTENSRTISTNSCGPTSVDSFYTVDLSTGSSSTLQHYVETISSPTSCAPGPGSSFRRYTRIPTSIRKIKTTAACSTNTLLVLNPALQLQGSVEPRLDVSDLAFLIHRPSSGLVAGRTNIAVVAYATDKPVTFSTPTPSPQIKFAAYSATFPGDAGLLLSWSTSLDVSSQVMIDGVSYAIALARIEDESEALTPQSVTIRAQANGGAPTDVNVGVYAPPVLLLHGLWGDTDASFDNLYNSFSSSNAAAGVGRGHYSNTTDFADKTVQAAVSSDINALLRQVWDKGIVSYNVDVIAHSMGGLASRAHAFGLGRGATTYKQPRNLNQGDIRKLVTIDTPHYGSNLADDLIRYRSNTVSNATDCSQNNPFNGSAAACMLFKNATKEATLEAALLAANMPIGSAVASLQTTNSILNQLNSATPAPGNERLDFYAVHGIAPNPAGLTERLLNALRGAYAVPKTISEVLGSGNDTVVPAPSQTGLNPKLVQDFPNVVHANISVGISLGTGVVTSPLVVNYAACVLRQRTEHLGACQALAVADQTISADATLDLDINGRTQAPLQSIVIQAPARSNQGVEMTVSATATGGRSIQQIQWMFTEDRGPPVIITGNGTSQTFTPATLGNLRITALAILSNGTYAIATLQSSIDPPPDPISVAFDVSEITVPSGGTLPLPALYATQMNVTRSNVSGSASYEIPDTDFPVVRISQGSLVALRDGIGSLQARFGTKSAMVRVVVGSPRTIVNPGYTFSSTLPSSRAVQTGKTASAFATIINSSAVDAVGCRISLNEPGLVGAFSFQRTNPSTNSLVGSANQAADIPAGKSASFVFFFTPSAPVSARETRLGYLCDNSGAAPNFIGLNTLSLVVSDAPIPDLIAVGATPTLNGILNIPTSGSAAFGAAVINIGAKATIDVTASTTPSGEAARSLPVSLFVCETATNGTCVGSSSPSGSVSFEAEPNVPHTFSVFAVSSGSIPLDPANNRAFLDFKSSGTKVGGTSVALKTF